MKLRYSRVASANFFFLLSAAGARGPGDAELGELGPLRVAVFALHFAKEALRFDPVVGVELLHRLVVRALRVGGVAERRARLRLFAAEGNQRGAQSDRSKECPNDAV